jgi:phosphohistidine phosphatase
MSKILVIIRHAKSTWDYESVSDIDRPLKEAGITKTFEVAQQLKSANIIPDLVISSPAIRALHTALILGRILKYPTEKIHINPVLYTKSDAEVLDFIKQTNDQISSLFIFGHNPVFTFLVNNFLKQRIDNLPTSGAVVFKFAVSKWEDISKKVIECEFSFLPKKIN